jgi:uncharacterized membrane protein (DUF4010 family)
MVDLTTTQAFARFGLALVIGLLIGIQREYSFRGSGEEGGLFAGVRTFGLIGLLGATAAYLADLLDTPVPLLALIAIVGAFLMVTYFVDAWRGDVGLTTEIAALLVLLAGALAYSDQTAVASGIAVATAVLLSLKFEMRRFVTALTPDDVAATLKLAFISVIILPVLPNQTYDVPSPFNVLNPFKTWLLVVLISGISFVGYVLTKVVGAERGIALTGLVGGLASSTAVTLSFTERSQGNESLARPFALAVMLAWTVMFGRVVVAVAAVNPVLAARLWIPMGASMAVGTLYCVWLFLQYRQRTTSDKEVELSNPFELGPAIKFGLLFATVLVIAKLAQDLFSTAGVYIAAIVSGLADADAIALSMAELQAEGSIAVDIAARASVIAAVSNTFAKGGIVLAGGTVALRNALLPGFVGMMVVGIVVAFIV